MRACFIDDIQNKLCKKGRNQNKFSRCRIRVWFSLVASCCSSVHLEVKMVFSAYQKERIIFYFTHEMRAPTIKQKLLKEGICVSREKPRGEF